VNSIFELKLPLNTKNETFAEMSIQKVLLYSSVDYPHQLFNDLLFIKIHFGQADRIAREWKIFTFTRENENTSNYWTLYWIRSFLKFIARLSQHK
jgi:hypothetical protein